MLMDRKELSERRACEVIGQHRSTQRQEPCVAQDDAASRARLRRVSRGILRDGAIGVRMCSYARRDGRSTASGCSGLWREEGLRVPVRPAQALPAGRVDRPSQAAGGAASKSRVGTGLPVDQTADGRILKPLHIVDEFTREARSMSSAKGTSTLIARSSDLSGWSPSAARPSTCAVTTGPS
jgi:putative transposase